MDEELVALQIQQLGETLKLVADARKATGKPVALNREAMPKLTEMLGNLSNNMIVLLPPEDAQYCQACGRKF